MPNFCQKKIAPKIQIRTKIFWNMYLIKIELMDKKWSFVPVCDSNVMQSKGKASIFLGLPLEIPPGNIKLRKFGIIPEIFPISCGHLS
mgnify:CR=1 FL=1